MIYFKCGKKITAYPYYYPPTKVLQSQKVNKGFPDIHELREFMSTKEVQKMLKKILHSE